MHRLKLEGFFSTELQSNWCCLPSVYRHLYIIWFLHIWCLTTLASRIVLVYDPIKVEMCFIRNQMSSMISMLFTYFANIWRRSLGMLHNLNTCIIYTVSNGYRVLRLYAPRICSVAYIIPHRSLKDFSLIPSTVYCWNTCCLVGIPIFSDLLNIRRICCLLSCFISGYCFIPITGDFLDNSVWNERYLISWRLVLHWIHFGQINMMRSCDMIMHKMVHMFKKILKILTERLFVNSFLIVATIYKV